MNRDEKLTRIAGLPPTERIIAGRRVLCPSEPGGGTWIATSDSGVTFALINWYSIAARVEGEATSRGCVVNAVCATTAGPAAAEILAALSLKQINPFRLIGIFPTSHEIVEWRWDLKRMVKKCCDWKSQQWISSGYDEPKAQRIRSRTFQKARRQYSAGSLDWLRRLHRCHSPHCGPFSTCMHRADAATVSYTEVAVSPRESSMRHHVGAPCQTCECFSGGFLRRTSQSWPNGNRAETKMRPASTV
jgi:hypothetical protein